MRDSFAFVFDLSAQAGCLFAAGKLTFDDEVELVRGLSSEYAKVKVYIPRSKKPLDYQRRMAGGTSKPGWM